MLLRPPRGSPLLVFWLLGPRELLTAAARSFYIVLMFLLSTLGLNLKDAF